MKLREIDIENFGIFTDRHFDFGESPFQLIHGPNEAGKSTLLQLLRQLLFGFPTRSPYQFETHAGEMAARALIDIADGRRISFRRRKGRTATVVGEVEGTTEKINDSALNGLLGNANIDLYQHVFGFSLTELSRGEESLKHANLNEAMFGGSLGSPSNLQEIQKSLETEAAGIFKNTGTKPVVNSLLREIRGRNTEIKNATLKPREFEDKEKELRSAEERVTSLGESRGETQKQLSHIDRLCQAVEPWLERKSIEDELEQIEVPAGVTAASGPEMQQLLNDQTRATSSLDDATKELAETKQQLNELKLAPEVLKVEAKVRSLEKDFSRVDRDQELLPQVRSQSQTILADVKSRVAGLNPEWNLDYLDTFQSSLEQREKLEELTARQSDLTKRQAEVDARRPDLKQRVEAAAERLTELEGVRPVPEIEELLERELAFRSAVASLEESTANAASLDRQLTTLKKRLSPALANPKLADDDLAALPVPLESLLRSFQERHTIAESALASAEARCEQFSETLQEKQAELAAKTAAEQVPDRLQLEGQRERRDAGWTLIRQKYLAEFGSDAESRDVDQKIESWIDKTAESLPDLYEREISAADRLADDRQAKAEIVAQRDQLLADIERAAKSLSDANTKRDLRKQELGGVSDEWNDLLAGFNVKPHPPEVILEWHRMFESWLDVRSKLIDSQARTKQLEEQTADFEKLLTSHSEAEADKESAATTIDRQLVAIRRRSEEIRKFELERQQIEKSLPADRAALESLNEEMSRLDDEHAAWSQEWSSLLSDFGFPADWSVRIASKTLQGLHDAKQKYRESTSLDEQATILQEEVTNFHEEARSVCMEIRPDLVDFPISDMVSRLSDDLAQATDAERQQTSLYENAERISRRVKACETEVAEFSNRIEKLLKAAEISSPEDFLEIARQAQRQQDLRAEHAALTRDLKRLAGVGNLDAFLNELAESDTDTLPLKRDEFQQRHQQIDRERDEALRLESEARTAFQSMDGTSEAAALQLEQESAYAQLGSAVDRLAPLVIAQTLLKRAVERFEKEHQPAMLTEVGRLLSRMTAGRYVAIRRRLDEAGTMQVEQHNGKLKTPDQLSTGTREQLYLAIRLAYVQHYCQESEPLPLIMDDILVNFDEQRAKNTLEVLFELPNEIQVLFLTCHEHMTELVRKLRPDVIPIELATA
ncbi:MAG: hypothetical protein ACI92S_001799 [Planctomycetaceae bacterium]|jgi:uncharacterized protein YhaN